MRRVIVTVVLVAAGVVAVELLADLTQTRGDRTPQDSRSEVVIEVASRDYKRDLDTGAENLIWACAGTTASDILDDPGVVPLDDGHYVFTVEPALGVENRRKMRGCLEDFTIDRLSGTVVSIDVVDNAGG